MIVVMKAGAAKAEVDAVTALIRSEGLEAFVSEGQERTIIGVVGIDIDQNATGPAALRSDSACDTSRLTERGYGFDDGAGNSAINTPSAR